MIKIVYKTLSPKINVNNTRTATSLPANPGSKLNNKAMMNNDKMVACRLNSSELLNRKQNVIAKIKKNILKRLELENGYEYHFNGSNETLDQLIEFIKLERQCCDFFTFQIQLEDEKVQTVLSITGPKNAKEFIRLELDL